MSELPTDFTHLHVHSHYTLLGATASLDDLVGRAAQDGLRCLALTDSNALFGVVAFARACRAAAIRPIIGMTAAVALPAEDLPPDSHAPCGRLVLLATNPDGYRSLCRLASLYQADSDRERRARGGFQWTELRDNTAGLICLTGGRTDWLERFLRAGNSKSASRYVARLGGMFEARCYLAVSPDLLTGALRPMAEEIMTLGRRFGLRAAAVQPVFCLEPAQRPLLRLLAAIDGNCPLVDVADGALPDGGDVASALEWPAPAAFRQAYAAAPDLLTTAGEIAAACGDALPDGRRLWPVLAGGDAVVRLRADAARGLAERLGDAPPATQARLDRELAAIADYGYAPLFLMVADIVRFARDAGIPVSTRGSVANSLLAYCLGITGVDPIAHDLLFERFLSPARRSPPDIDLDFCSRRRDEVLDYVRRTYGDERVALVSTMNTLQPRSAVRETGKAYRLPDAEIDELVERLPHGWHPDDTATAEMLCAADTIGVFQCESDGARRTLRQLRARNVADLAVAGAFFKPGPAMGGMARAFVRRYRGEEPVTFLHPALEPILGRTMGVLLFQEQILRIAREIAGLSWEQADGLRRGMSKFQAHEIEALAAAFADGCCRAAPDGPGFSREQAARLWDQILPFAGYGFNQGHATAYADVTYRSAYVKAHWPAEFLRARLADSGGFHHPAIYMAEAVRLGIAVRPPHVNFSDSHFTLTYEHAPDSEQPVLWMGLAQVRELRAASVRAIVAERAGAPFTGPHNLLARVPLTPKEITHLIRCGALDGLGASRAAMLDEIGRGRGGATGQMRFTFLDAPAGDTPVERVAWETELLGQPLSTHPLALVAIPRGVTALRRLPEAPGRPVTVCAVRLPGWPGGGGFFIGDSETFAVARLDKALTAQRIRLPYWRPTRLAGRWQRDEWEGGWLRVEEVSSIQ